MASPGASVLANCFLVYHESQWLSDCPAAFKTFYYYRYVDDTFLVFSEESRVPLFLKYLNSKHKNITFTCKNRRQGKYPI